MIKLILIAGFVGICLAQTIQQQTCDANTKQAVIQEGANAVIGGLFAIHNKGKDNYGCGSPSSDMQAYEAMRWALERLNKKGVELNGDLLEDTYVPGIKLGMEVKDYCDHSDVAISGAQDLYPRLNSQSSDCPASSTQLSLGIIGPSTSTVSESVASFLKSFSIPVLSFYSTSPTLSDQDQYPNFMRTVSPDGLQMKILTEVLTNMNWKFVVIVYTDDLFGRDSYKLLHKQLLQAGICLTAAIPVDPDDDSDAAINDILNGIINTGTTGTIYLGHERIGVRLLEQGEVVKDAGKLQWVFTDAITLGHSFLGQTYPRGIISVLAGGRKIVEYEDHWIRINETNPSEENPWFREWYMSRNKCKLPGVTTLPYASMPACVIEDEPTKRLKFVQDQFVEPAVHAVYAYAYALREAHADKCKSPGICPQLSAMKSSEFLQYLKNVNFTYTKRERIESMASAQYEPYFKPATLSFDANGDIVKPYFDVWNYNNLAGPYKFRRAGTYMDGQLQINMEAIKMYSEDRQTRLGSLPTSLCPAGICQPCLSIPTDVKYYYIPGDVVVNGLFSVHLHGTNPAISCGDFDTLPRAGIQFMEGMMWAINQINDANPKLLNGVRLGGLAMDDCRSRLQGTALITGVRSGFIQVKDENGISLDPKTIQAYEAAQNSGLSINIAEVMNSLKKPQVNYGGGTAELMDVEKYPYHLRTINSVTQQALAVVMALKKLGWYFVQVAHGEDPYPVSAAKTFKHIAAQHGICVVASYAYGNQEMNKPADVIRKLEYKPTVKAVVVWADESDGRLFLENIKSQNATGKYNIFGGWGLSSLSLVKDLEDVAAGMLSVAPKKPALVLEFEEYLKNLRVATAKNPWFTEWYETFHKCYVNAADKKGYSKQCTSLDATSVTEADGFHFNGFSAHSIYAAYAIAKGLDATLKQVCGVNYNGVCGNFKSRADIGMLMVENIMKMRFVDKNGYEFFFNNREGTIPFKYQNYNSGTNELTMVGEFVPTTGAFSFDTDTVLLYGGKRVRDVPAPTCPQVCVECMYLLLSQKYMYIPGDLIIPAVFDVHKAGPTPFSCGDLRFMNGFQYTEAFAFALDAINNKKPGVPVQLNVKLGGFAFDGCTDPLRTENIVRIVHSKLLPLRDENFNLIPNDKIQGWLTYDSQSTIEVGDLLSSLGIPLVTPGATTAVLNDKTRFSTFFRTIPSDEIISKGMARLANTLNFEYIITLNAPDYSSRGARDIFRKYAEEMGICIAASYEFVTDGTFDQLIEYIVNSDTRVVAVFSEPTDYITKLLQAKRASQLAGNIIFISNRPWEGRVDPNQPDAYRSLIFRTSPIRIEQFREFLRDEALPSLTHRNPWLVEYYQEKFRCDLFGNWKYGVSCRVKSIVDANFDEDVFVLPTINAVFAIAKAVHETLISRCGPSYNSVCANFFKGSDIYADIMSKMDNNVEFTDYSSAVFKFIEREVNRNVEVHQIGDRAQEAQVAAYTGDLLTVTDVTLPKDYEKTPSRCIKNCLKCLKKSGTDIDFDFIQPNGDLLFVGLFDIHKKGSTPYTCGDINTKHGLPLQEAFNFAIEYVNNKTGIFKDLLNGVTIGGISLDVCQSPERAGNLVANLHNGNVKLTKGRITLKARRFDVYIGTLESEASIRVADVTDVLGIAQITYGATSLELRDFRNYQFLMRAVPADDKQARGMISYLKRFDINNIQIINTYDSVGKMGHKEFVRLAYLNKICVDQTITIGHLRPITDEEVKSALNKLSQSNGTVIVLFIDDPTPIFRVLNSQDSGMTSIIDKYFFLGTDKWGADLEHMSTLGGKLPLINAATFDVENSDIPQFDKYLEFKTPANYDRNPWFKEYYEKVYNCQYKGNSSDADACTNDFGISRADSYRQDPYALYVINSVFAAAIGVHHALIKECGDRKRDDYYFGLCNLLRVSGQRRQTIFQGIQKSVFNDLTEQPFFFTSDGESDRGYHIYKPYKTEMNSQGYHFVDAQIGSYNESFLLKIDASYDMDWVSRCKSKDECKCEFPAYVPSRYMLDKSPDDLNLVYISDVHKRDPNNPFACGDIHTGGNLQNLLAFFFAIQEVNKNAGNLFPASSRLGGVALDTCSSPYRIGQDVYSLLSGEGFCQASDSSQIIPPSTIVAFLAKNTENAITTSSILSPLNMTTLSQSATSVELSNKLYHSHFLRTVPPDDIQSLIIVQILRRFGWNYVSIVYSDNLYGNTATKAFIEEAKGSIVNPICTGNAIPIPMNATLDETKNIVEELSLQVGARVVVVFTTQEHARLLLEATLALGLQHQFVWIASESWADSLSIVKGVEEAAAGAITMQIQTEIVPRFKDFMKQLTFTNRMGIPDDWFEEIYQTFHQCRILSSVNKKSYPSVCTGQEKITDEMVQQDPFVFHTILAVYSVAYGLSDACNKPDTTISACLLEKGLERKNIIYDKILGTQFNYRHVPKGFSFDFNKDGYGDVGYNILNFQRDPTTGLYKYGKLGSYDRILSLSPREYYGPTYGNAQIFPVSRCPATTQCSCKNSDFSDYTLNTAAVTKEYYIIGENGSYIDPVTGEQAFVSGMKSPTDRFKDIWAIIVAAIAALGAISAASLFVYLLVVYPVRSGTTVLGYMLCFGIICLYCLVFAFIAHATREICGFRRFALGFCYAICYSALFVKVIDNWRSRKREDLEFIKYNKLGKPLGLFFVACLLICVQVIINTEWMILVIPTAVAVVYNGQLWPRCTPHDFYDEGLVMSNIFVMVLVVLCFVFGLWTWKNTRNHKESRWILGIAALTIPCWVLWSLVSIIGEYKLRDAAVCIGLLYNATIMLLLGPVRKLFLLSKYQDKIAEEERKSQYLITNDQNEYSSVYARQYDNNPRMREGDGSVRIASYSS